MHDQGVSRLARAGLFTAVAVALSLTAHVAGGGAPPSLGVTALAAFVVLCGGVLVAGRRLGRLPMIALLGAVQFLLHGLFAAAGAQTHGCVSGGHHVAPTCASGALPSVALPGGALPGGHSTGPAMLLAHLLTTVVLALLLARGERIGHTLAVALGRTAASSPSLPGPPARAPRPRALPTARAAMLRHVPHRRGPPQLVLGS